MKPTSTRLIKMLVNPKAHGDKPPAPSDYNREQDEFFKKLLPSLNNQLEGKNYFCGQDITIADIQYYCEISTILNLTKRELSESEFPQLSRWFNERCSQFPEITETDDKLKEIIAKYNL
jgi:glutathione S-transferase